MVTPLIVAVGEFIVYKYMLNNFRWGLNHASLENTKVLVMFPWLYIGLFPYGADD
jgi:hypothetical protein